MRVLTLVCCVIFFVVMDAQPFTLSRLEEGRSRSLLKPALIKLQKRYPKPEERAGQTAQLFLKALSTQDTELTADLLNPNNILRDKSRSL